VHAPQQTATLKDGEVPADRLARDVQLVGEHRDLDPRAVARLLQDPGVALVG